MIADTINSIKEHINDAYGIVEEKGGTIPQNKNLENMADSIGSISGGGGLDIENYINGTVSSATAVQNGFKNSITKIDSKLLKNVNVTNMTGFFGGMDKLKEVDLNNVVFSGTSATNLFNTCQELETVKIGNFNFSNVTSFASMFQNCVKLKNIEGKITNSKATDFSYMFKSCSVLENVDFSSISFSKVTNMSSMFEGCNTLDLNGQFSNISNPLTTNLSNTFNNYKKDLIVGMSNEKVTNMSSTFANFGTNDTQKLNLSNFNTNACTNMYRMFISYRGYPILDLRNFNTSKVTRTDGMFNSASYLQEIWMDNCDFSNVTNSSSMFQNCGINLGSGKYTKVYVKDATAQTFILNTTAKPSGWSTANVIIAGSADDDRNL